MLLTLDLVCFFCKSYWLLEDWERKWIGCCLRSNNISPLRWRSTSRWRFY